MLSVGALTRQPHCGFSDKTVGEDVMIEHDNQFQNLFEMYKQEMHCRLHLIVVEKTVF